MLSIKERVDSLQTFLRRSKDSNPSAFEFFSLMTSVPVTRIEEINSGSLPTVPELIELEVMIGFQS